MPRVEIGMSIYRQPIEWVAMAIRSVLNQSYQNWNLKLRLDGVDALTSREFQQVNYLVQEDARLTIVIGETRLGCFGSYHEIFKCCQAQYLAQLDADDLLAPDALSDLVSILEQNPKSPFAYSLCALIDENSRIKGYDKRALHSVNTDSDLLSFNTFHLRVVRTEYYHRCGGYDGNYKYAGDYDLSLRLAEHGKPIRVAKPLYLYRVHQESASQRKKVETHREGVKAVRSAMFRRNPDARDLLVHSPSMQTVAVVRDFKGPVLIAGMHRSGTSVVTSLLQRSIGIDLGENLLAGDRDNIDGYQEDIGVITLHSKWFGQFISDGNEGWSDWGINEKYSVGCLGSRHWDQEAHNYIEARLRKQKDLLWGWKDPRTTMILPYWHQLLGGEGLVVCIYRAPWDVSDSLQRISNGKFRDNPDLALRVWSEYNRRIIEFCEARPEYICLLLTSEIAQRPELIAEVILDRWGLAQEGENQCEQAMLKKLIRDDKLVTRSADDPITKLYATAFTETFEIWERLNQISDSPCKAINKGSSQELEGHVIAFTSKQPRISIVIPTLNPSNLLLEAIASIQRTGDMDRHPYEIIIVNDGSTRPDSVQLLQRLSDYCGIRIINQENQGLAIARNTGIEHSKSNLILPLDDDNRLLSPYMHEAISILQNDYKIDMVYGDRKDFGAASGTSKIGSVENVNDISRFNRIDACAVFRKSLWSDVGGYDLHSNPLEDWDMWLSALTLGKRFYYLEKECFEYRIRENSMLQKHLSSTHEHTIVIQYLRSKHNLKIGRLDGASS